MGSSNARIPQFKQNVSASASRMMREAKTWNKQCQILNMNSLKMHIITTVA